MRPMPAVGAWAFGFPNPLVLGGNFDVLSTDIFFAIVGSQNDPGRAAALSIVLLFLTLSAFVLQRQWLGRRSYTTISGKGDSGLPVALPRGLRIGIYAVTMPWFLFTIVLYLMILVGGFVKSLGSTGKLVSFGRTAFPHVAKLTQGFRAVFAVKSGSSSVPIEIDVVALGAGRNEITLMLTGPVAVREVLRSAEVRLARRLAGRMSP